MYAIIETGGKQYKVSEGDRIVVEKLPYEAGETVTLDKVLLVGGPNGVKVGNPTVEGAKVVAQVEAHGKAEKIVVFKYKPKKNYHKKQGHRQPYTALKIESIQA